MANTKITGLTEQTTLDENDLVESVDDPAGTPASRKMKHLNVVKAGMGFTGTSQQFIVREVLHDETLGAAGSFDVSSISQAYDHLELLLWARGDASVASDGVKLFFNNDTTDANYHWQRVMGRDGGSGFNEAAQALGGHVPGASSPANSFGMIKVFIPFYTNTSSLRIAQIENLSLDDAGIVRYQMLGLSWEDGGATAINRITIQTDNDPTDEFVANSQLQIIGVGPST